VLLGLSLFFSLRVECRGARPPFPKRFTHGDGPATSCNDLNIEFDGRAAVVQAEEHAFSKAEAPVLRATGETNGGVEVVGWDKDNYSVTLCKAAAPYDDSAKILAEIKMVAQAAKCAYPVHRAATIGLRFC